MGDLQNRRPGSVVDWRFGATGVADFDAPTLAEITALSSFECGLTGAVNRGRSGTSIDISGLCATSDALIAGTIKNSMIAAELWRELGDGVPDEYWTLFDDSAIPKVTQHMAGCMAGFSGAAGAPAEGDIIDLYMVQVAVRSPGADGRDDAQRFGIELTPLEVRFGLVLPGA